MQLPALRARTRRAVGVAAAALAVALLGTACQEAQASPLPRPTIPPLPTIALPAPPTVPGTQPNTGNIVLTCTQLGTSKQYLCTQTGTAPAPVTPPPPVPPSTPPPPVTPPASSTAPPPAAPTAPWPIDEGSPEPTIPLPTTTEPRPTTPRPTTTVPTTPEAGSVAPTTTSTAVG